MPSSPSQFCTKFRFITIMCVHCVSLYLLWHVGCRTLQSLVWCVASVSHVKAPFPAVAACFIKSQAYFNSHKVSLVYLFNFTSASRPLLGGAFTRDILAPPHTSSFLVATPDGRAVQCAVFSLIIFQHLERPHYLSRRYSAFYPLSYYKRG